MNDYRPYLTTKFNDYFVERLLEDQGSAHPSGIAPVAWTHCGVFVEKLIK
jgi:hypothetical protein